MHYLTLVAVDAVDYEVDPIKDESVKLAIEQLTAYQSQSIFQSTYVKCRLAMLRSLSNSFARHVAARVAERLEPYCECPDDMQYIEFTDKTEDIQKQYEGNIDCIKFPNGTIKPAYCLSNKFFIRDGLVYQKNFGKLKQSKRSRKAKKMSVLLNYPFKKLYKTFESFAEDYCGYEYDDKQKAYGYYCNPNSFWDWYVIGGRWPCSFLIKEDCAEFMDGDCDLDYKFPDPPVGYRWTSAARKKDIQWQAMIDWKTNYYKDRFEKLKLIFEAHVVPPDLPDLVIKEDGIYERGTGDFPIYLAGESYEENFSRYGSLYNFDCLMLPNYYVDDFYWHYQEYQIVSDLDWLNEIKKFYHTLSDDTVLVSVDCHD